MLNWLHRNSNAVQAFAALTTAVVALAALIGVKYQIDASYRVQREQSSKEIYREMLNISIANPDFAAPDYCALKQSPKLPAYEAYVEYVLYTAEQVLEMNREWQPTIQGQLETHAGFICATDDWSGYSTDVEALVNGFREASCKAVAEC
jgi:hypothetical protein